MRPAVGLRLKALDLVVSTAAAQCVVFPLWGVVVEPRLDSVSCQCSRGNFGVYVLFIFIFFFDLLCKRFSSPPCIGSAVAALFIKLDESLFQ
jgi:hypothetical protein